jgi:hypothetical protein
MGVTRKLLIAVGLVVGIGALGLSLSDPAPDRSGEISEALAIGEINEAAAESAPQQQVVNGWVTRDLVAIQSRQLDTIVQQNQRTQWLLGAIAVLVGLTLVASNFTKTTRPDDRPVEPGPPVTAPRSV